MAPAGGNKDNVKILPFGTKPSAPSDYAHLNDKATVSFAKSLAISLPDARKPPAPKKKSSAFDDKEGKDTEIAKEVAKKPSQSKIDPDDLARFLESEGGGDAADMCNLPRCMDVVSQIILNDKNSKVEKAMIQEEMLELMKSLQESEKEEARVSSQAEAQAKEVVVLEKQVEGQADTLKHIETAKEDLEAFKRDFSGKQALLEKDRRNWVTKYKTAQTALTKAIWRKPGQAYDDEEHSIFEGSVRTIRTVSVKEVDKQNAPVSLPYELLANLDKVSDFNEVPSAYPTYSRYVQDQIDVSKVNKMRIPATGSTFAAARDHVSGVSFSFSFDDDASAASITSYRKSALQMQESVKSYLACSAAKSLKRSITNPFQPVSPIKTESVLSVMNRSGSTDTGITNTRSRSRTSASSPITAGGRSSLNPWLKPLGNDRGSDPGDDRSVASIGSLSGMSALTSLQSVSSSSVVGAGNSGSTTSNIIVRPKKTPLPKSTGKTRIIQSGIGTLNRKTKSIAQLLAEDEALN